MEPMLDEIDAIRVRRNIRGWGIYVRNKGGKSRHYNCLSRDEAFARNPFAIAESCYRREMEAMRRASEKCATLKHVMEQLKAAGLDGEQIKDTPQ